MQIYLFFQVDIRLWLFSRYFPLCWIYLLFQVDIRRCYDAAAFLLKLDIPSFSGRHTPINSDDSQMQ